MSTFTDHKEKSRFELAENGHLVFADYQVSEGVCTISHVEADLALRGTGAAGRLMEALLVELRARDLKIQPDCSYAAAYIARHPEYVELLAG